MFSQICGDCLALPLYSNVLISHAFQEFDIFCGFPFGQLMEDTSLQVNNRLSLLQVNKCCDKRGSNTTSPNISIIPHFRVSPYAPFMSCIRRSSKINILSQLEVAPCYTLLALLTLLILLTLLTLLTLLILLTLLTLLTLLNTIEH